MSEHAESVITVNGVELTKGQSLAVRVAVTDFHSRMSDPEERELLGEIADSYKVRLGEVLKIVLSKDASK